MSLEDFLHPYLRSYTNAPQWAKWVFGLAYGLLPMRLRHGTAYSRFAREALLREPEEIAHLARAKLTDTIICALNTIPAYQSYLGQFRPGDDPAEWLMRLPLTSKLDIKADVNRYLSTALGSGSRLPMFTGGSTANPLAFYLHRGISRPKEAGYVADFDRRAGLQGHEVILNLRGRTVASASEPSGRLWMYEPIRRHLILSSDHLEERFMPEYVAALRHWRPEFIQAFPSALYPLARWLASHPAPDITERIRTIQLTSENVYDYQLSLLREVFACPVLMHYGHTERVLMACSMPDDDRYFFWPLYGHLELLDSEGHPITQPGVLGEIVGTSFDNLVMPFIRYRTGDLGVWSDRPPHPGLPGFPVLENLSGRLQEFVVCKDHRLITVTTLGAAHFQDFARAEAIQYEQFEPGRLILKLVLRQPISEQYLADIALAVEKKTQYGCAVEVKIVDSVGRTIRGKQQLLIQHLDLSRYFGGSRMIADSTAITPTPSRQRIVMIGTAREGAGGIASVISTYASHELFARWPIIAIISHVTGTPLRKSLVFAGSLKRFLAILLKGEVGLLHLHTSSGASFWRKSVFSCLGFLFRKPVLLHIHSGGFMAFYKERCGPLRRLLVRYVFTHSARVIALSPSWRERFLGIAPQANVVSLPNPVIVMGGQPRQLVGEGVVLFLGKLSVEKGIFDLIDAWRLVQNRIAGARLVIAGDGDVVGARAHAEKAGLSATVEFPGWVGGDVKTRLLARSDVFVLPSYFEGMPISILEAFGSGIPCVASTVGGIPDMMTDGVEGRLIKPGDSQALAAALIQILSDAEKYAEMSRAAFARFVSAYSADVVVPELEKLYLEFGMKPYGTNASEIFSENLAIKP